LFIHRAAHRFLSLLVLDGLLERHPNLRGSRIEIGAGWSDKHLEV